MPLQINAVYTARNKVCNINKGLSGLLIKSLISMAERSLMATLFFMLDCVKNMYVDYG